jgi:hypothetical protein
MRGLRHPADLTQDAVKIDVFDFHSFGKTAANFIFASPRDRKVTRAACGEPQAARGETGQDYLAR